VSSLEFSGFIASLAMGLVLSLTGAGGSILTVPILVYLFGFSSISATTHSLGIIGLVALWGAVQAHRSKELHLRSALLFALPSAVGVVVSRRLLLPKLPELVVVFDRTISKDSFVLMAFSVLMLAAAWTMIRSSVEASRSHDSKEPKPESTNKPWWLLAAGAAVGILAGFVGAGGGFLIVPVLVAVAKLNIRQAVGTSLVVIAVQSLIGAIGDPAPLASWNAPIFFSVLMLAIFGMSLGSTLRNRISSSRIKLGFGIFVLTMGAAILIQQLSMKEG
jgi:uncharacterized membrane protein YfcA